MPFFQSYPVIFPKNPNEKKEKKRKDEYLKYPYHLFPKNYLRLLRLSKFIFYFSVFIALFLLLSVIAISIFTSFFFFLFYSISLSLCFALIYFIFISFFFFWKNKITFLKCVRVAFAVCHWEILLNIEFIAPFQYHTVETHTV